MAPNTYANTNFTNGYSSAIFYLYTAENIYSTVVSDNSLLLNLNANK